MSKIPDYLLSNPGGKKIFALTSRPISRSLEIVVDRCNKGLYVSKEDVMEIPEIKWGYSIQENLSESATSDCDPIKDSSFNLFRKSLREGIRKIGSFTGYIKDDKGNKAPDYTGRVISTKNIHIVIGFSDSDKISALVEKISVQFGAKVFDEKMPKQWIPMHFGGWGEFIVREELKNALDEAMEDSLRQGENIVIPVTSNSIQELDDIINAVVKRNRILEESDSGFIKLYVHYMDVNPSEALGSCLNEYIEDGVFVDFEKLQSFLDTPNCMKELFNKLKDGYTTSSGQTVVPSGICMWTGNVPQGEDIVLLESSGDFVNPRFINNANKDRSNIIEPLVENELQKKAASTYIQGLAALDQINVIMMGANYDVEAVNMLKMKQSQAEDELNEMFGNKKENPDYVYIMSDDNMTKDERKQAKQLFEYNLNKLGEKTE